MLSKSEARRRGEALLKKLDGDGWKLRLWENLGWHASVFRGPLTVYVDSYSSRESYSCLLGAEVDEDVSGGELFWTDTFQHRDPNVVVRHQLKVAREFVRRCQDAIGLADGTMELVEVDA